MSTAERLTDSVIASSRATQREGDLRVATPTDSPRHVLLVTGLCTPEGYMWPLGHRLQTAGLQTHDLGHMLRANVVYGMRGAVAEAVDRVVQQTQEPVDLVGYSLGGYFSADHMMEHPENVRRFVGIAGVLHSAFGIHLPEGADATTIYSYTDTVVPYQFSRNPTIPQEHAVWRSTHIGIPFRKGVADLVTTALTRPDVSHSKPTTMRPQEVVTIRR